jgi:hypothetical protein
MRQPIEVRPYQLLCLFCDVGQPIADGHGDAIRRLAAAIRDEPDRPLTLRCNVTDVYAYQDPGPADDIHGGTELNRKRDLDVLCRLDLAPGSTLPARTLLYRVQRAIPIVRDLCGSEAPPCDAWRGCPRAAQGWYAKGVQAGIDALVPPRQSRAVRLVGRLRPGQSQCREPGLRQRPRTAPARTGDSGGRRSLDPDPALDAAGLAAAAAGWASGW